MTKSTKDIVLAALNRYRGDNYERVSNAFRNLTPTEMGKEYGNSGQTRLEILNSYRDHVKQVETAIQEIRLS